MNVTVQQFRKSVLGWLTEEGATVEQAMQLQTAIYAGAIAGDNYGGNRGGANDEIYMVDKYQQINGEGPEDSDSVEVGHNCGCLVDTFERIRHGRPSRNFGPSAAEAFSLALMIGLGDTPSNSKWSRAAAKGVEDYIVWLEAA